MILSVLVLAPLAAASDLTWDPVVDTSITLGSGVSFLLLEYVVKPGLPPSTLPGGTVSALDEVALDRWNPTIATASDGLLYGSIGLGLVVSAVGGRTHGDGWVPLGIMSESLALSGTTVSLVKLAVRRPRPFTYLDDPTADVQEELADVDATLSFPSGHTGMTATASFCAASLLVDEGMPAWPLYGGAAALTTTVASFRVLAGRHFPTDVVAGAAIGTAIGLAVPSMHTASGVGATTWVQPGDETEPTLLGVRGYW